ncbi:hypothetical protein POX_a01458 [Penicillium oxalicum]|uniref:Uncharacterized protein n=1 Tax=Penicillium oxalicum (strain 114-2 / CGMCC 5302) TaxID=933388 RepID=S8BEQ3_PENO1|nr:hypothetical protein POX_a01458 [Penicillium oxalicum]EPS33547.1 hypothetical protein PDE_08509 [Penicillium oxalicum 114-2]KAI2794857.1 hypothetical protein POX_a01458 [Penicillium oxalicum]
MAVAFHGSGVDVQLKSEIGATFNHESPARYLLLS